MVRLLNVFEAPWRARLAVTSTVALLVLIATSVWRKLLGLQYEVWRVLHDALAVLVVGLGMAHAVMWGNYIGHLGRPRSESHSRRSGSARWLTSGSGSRS